MTDLVQILHASVKWQDAYPAIEVRARQHLSGLPPSIHLSTDELAKALAGGQKLPKAINSRLFQALKALSQHSMADCITKAPPAPSRFGKEIRRTLWHVSRGAVAPASAPAPKKQGWDESGICSNHGLEYDACPLECNEAAAYTAVHPE